MKNLTDEYKSQIENDFAAIMPDLWSKIEAGVDAIEASKKMESDTSVNNTNDDNINLVQNNFASESNSSNVVEFNAASNEVNRVRKTKKVKNINRYSGILVAVAAVVILVPALSILLKVGGKTSTNSAPAEAPAGDAAAMPAEAPSSAASDDMEVVMNFSKGEKPMSVEQGANAGLQEYGETACEEEAEEYEDCDETISDTSVLNEQEEIEIEEGYVSAKLKKDHGVYVYIYKVGDNDTCYYTFVDDKYINIINKLMENKEKTRFVLSVKGQEDERTVYKIKEVEVE